METFAKALKQAVVSKSKEKPLHKDGWYQRRSGSGSEAAVLRLLTAVNGTFAKWRPKPDMSDYRGAPEAEG